MLNMVDLPQLKTVGARIKFARELADMKQAKLAEKVGVGGQSVSNWERDENALGMENLNKVAEALNVPVDWLMGRTGVHSVNSRAESGTRIPLISRVKAGEWAPTFNPYEPDDGQTFLYTDIQVSDQVFALEIDGNSMEPEFRSGDTVIIDPLVQPRPGDYVAAKLINENEATFKKYRPKGGNVIELVPLNADWPVLVIDESNPGAIIGTMIEHRRYRRR